MGKKNKNYPKQPKNPDRKPSESVTWVRNWEKIKDRRVVVVDKPAYTPKPK
jgi:hypothetical protein